MKIWRIYRLPGSRMFWHVDAGPGTRVFDVRQIEIDVFVRSVDIGNGMPRAWLEIPSGNVDLHIVDGKAVWSYEGVSEEVRRSLHVAGIS